MILWTVLPLLLLGISVDSEAGKAKDTVFRRNNYDTSENNYYQDSYTRFRRQFPGANVDTLSTGYEPTRKGGSRTSQNRASLPIRPRGGPEAFLTAEDDEDTQEDDSLASLRVNFPSFPTRQRPSFNAASNRGIQRGRATGNSNSEAVIPSYTFPGSGGNRLTNSGGFGSPPQSAIGSYRAGTSELNASPAFNSRPLPSDSFPVPGGFASNSNFDSGASFRGSINSNRRTASSSSNSFPPFPPSAENNPFPSFPSSAENNPFPQFPSPGLSDPYSSSGNINRNSGNSLTFPGAGSSGPFSGAGFPGRNEGPIPVDANLLNALRGNPDFAGFNLDEFMGIPPTTTKPPLRIPSEEDRDKIFSGAAQPPALPSLPVPLVAPDPPPSRRGGSPVVLPPTERSVNNDAVSGCGQQPPRPLNARMQCSSYAGCRVSCQRGYRFPTGEAMLYMACEDGRWEVRGGPWTTIPDCEPICEPACQNDGICLQPNVCQCPDNFEGPHCDQPKVAEQLECADKPPTPMNSRIFCSKEECVARCYEKHEFAENVTRLYFDCVAASWRIRDRRWTTVPDCIPLCDPVCQNGGRCLAPDVCECTPEFRGDHCQYPITNCDPKNLQFNGGYNCTGEGMDFGCKLWCPHTFPFKFPAAEFYNCDYATGRWSPQPIPECDYGSALASFEEESVSFGQHLSIVEAESSRVVNYGSTTRRHRGVCFTWSGMHYKSFDGRVYSFDSDCPYTLLQDAGLGTFTLNLIPNNNCGHPHCPRKLKLFLEGDEYTLSTTPGGMPELVYKETSLAIPGQMNGLVTERVAHFVVLKLAGIGLTVKWDLENLVVTEVSEMLWNRTAGLCGLLDGVDSNDWAYADGSSETQLNTFLEAWEANTFGASCTTPPATRSPCAGNPAAQQASQFCSRLLQEPRFAECTRLVDVMPFVEACKWDYCSCANEPSTCACDTFSSFFRECNARGGTVQGGWRSNAFCPMECEGEKEYKACMPAIAPRCGQASDSPDPQFCVEGCDCPQGKVLMYGKCVGPEDCPCTYHNKTYSTGDTIPNDCNSCTCIAGEWQCTEVKCGSRCASVGDPHYTTFDGKKFDFMGKCSYYLVKGTDYSIEAENTPCAGAISEAMNFPASVVSQFPSCTKSVTITVGNTVVKLLQGREVTINGVQTTSLPQWIGDIYVKKASNLFVIAELPNGLDVWWDGQTRAYVDAPADLRGQVSGLCGTFNDNQRDDFLTPEGDVEQNHIAFANKWKTSDRCEDMPLTEETHPCDRHIQNKDAAEKYCTQLKSNLFADCHLTVDPESYYSDCLYDLCSCEADLADCMCPIFAAYSKECVRKGIIVDWRSQIRECGVHCTGGQQYQLCGDSCTHTCKDLATNPGCKRRCVEGCNCPEGFTLNSDEMCVPMVECPCIYLSREYRAGYERMETDAEGNRRVCECVMAQWECRVPTQNELQSERFFEMPQVGCQEQDHEEYTNCMPDEEVTCKTMHFPTPTPVTDTCRSGCECAEGYVRDSDSGVCVDKRACPCHHGGRSYGEQETILEECNTCTCTGGEWSCTTNECPGICTAWGDSHFKTFDGKIYEFHGTCDYMLAKSRSKGADSFEVSIQNVPCGTNGVTCAKSVTLRLGARGNQEVIEFSKDKPAPTNTFARAVIREAGVFLYAEVPDMGLVLQWDKGTRAYLTLATSWKGNVKGLCGNFNGDDQDDFQTPSGGTAEASARIFGDSWRLQNYCPESTVIEDTCALHPHRKVWAAEKCAVLKSSVFSACHSEVPVDPYVSRCQFDSCGCDTGGDCECLCTALAAYAHECNIHGVYVSWRTPELCPMQCDESCEHYEPCIPACPTPNCDTLLDPQSPNCQAEVCVEGCAKDVCPPGQVHKSATDKECVPEPECNNKCLEIDGEVYMEGDKVSEDDCHTCFCTRKKKVCRGSPCTTLSSPYSTTPRPRVTTPMAPSTSTPAPTGSCKTGWTNWINSDHPISFKKNSDVEVLPDRILMRHGSPDTGYCSKEMFGGIRCRVVGTHEPFNSTGQPVLCSLQQGLLCQGGRGVGLVQDSCLDYEFSVYCDCGREVPETTSPPSVATEPPTVVPEVVPSVPEECEEEWTPWLNAAAPTSDGEFETVEGIRELFSFCPKHYIKEVQCRYVTSQQQVVNWVQCGVEGSLCRFNRAPGGPRTSYCSDTEIRVLCQCDCQDGLGMADGRIPDEAITFSNSEFSQAETAPLARLYNNDRASRFRAGAWNVDKYIEPSEQWIQIDLGERKEVTGVVTQGSPTDFFFVTEFAVQVSPTGSQWQQIKDDDNDNAKRFTGNTDMNTPVTNLFPAPVYARFVRIIPLATGGAGGAMRVELKGCDVPDEEDIPVTTSEPLPAETVPLPPVCEDGWTPWMSSDTPHPGDWDDIENYSSLRLKYSFCEETMIIDTECQVALAGVPADQSGQTNIICSRNHGLQCVDELQSPQHCMDYEIRFFCDCTITTVSPSTPLPIPLRRTTPPSTTSSTTPGDAEVLRDCDPNVPAKPHQTSCQKFYECAVTSYTSGYLIEKICGPGTLFNPITLTCDWPAVVMQLRPECEYLDELTTTTTTAATSTTAPEVECTETWTAWFNVSHPQQDNGDFETYDFIKTIHPELCHIDLITDVECQFNRVTVTQIEGPPGGSRGRKGGRKGGRHQFTGSRYTSTLEDYTLSDDNNVVCDNNGLTCDNLDQGYGQQCQDYAVRFFCSCQATTPAAIVTTTPALPPYTDTRGSSATPEEHMYNDWCPVGRTMEPRAIPCARLCLYYGRVIAQAGHCTSPNDYAPACADEETGVVCPPGMFLRDKATCVAIYDCNCYLPNGISAPPGRPFLVSDCEVCMCVDNTLRCSASECAAPLVPTLTSRDLKEFTCNEWGPWLDMSTPDQYGETESLQQLQTVYPELCAEPSAVECATAADGLDPKQTGQTVLCSVTGGLQCRNDRNPGGCLDYKVRFLCLCEEPEGGDGGSPNTTTTTTRPPPPRPPGQTTPRPPRPPGQTTPRPPRPPVVPATTPLPPLPGCFQPFWTEWFNTSHPFMADGDYEMIDDIAASEEHICPKAYIQDIECVYNKEIVSRRGAGVSKGGRGGRKGRPQPLVSIRYEEADYTESEDVYVVCSRDVGLTCLNSQQPRGQTCQDYAIRVYCMCEPVEVFTTVTPGVPGVPGPTATTTTVRTPVECPLFTEAVSCAVPCDRVCMLHKTALQQSGTCTDDGGCAPACFDPLTGTACPPGQFLQDEATCVAAAQCSCVLPDGTPVPAGETVSSSRCERCACMNNRLLCSTIDNCIEDTTIEPPVRVTTFLPLEATTTTKGISTSTTTIKPAPPSIDLKCNQWTPWLNMRRNAEGDFQLISELRQRDEFSDLCEVPADINCREASSKLPADQLGQVLTCDASIGLVCRNVDNSEDCYDYEVSFLCVCDEEETEVGVTTTLRPGLGQTTTPVSCDGWSNWINDNKPWLGDGDTERMTLQQLREEMNFCIEGDLADIECANTANGLSEPDVGTVCDVKFGFICENGKQPKGACYDYKIRYYCSCETTPATTTVVMVPSTVTPPYVCLPEDYVNLLNDVPDSSITASSSINVYYSPIQARLNDPSARGWSPRSQSPNEYLQVELTSPQVVYGLTVAGAMLSNEAVRAFTVQTSLDGLVWSAITDDPEVPWAQTKYFQGPSGTTAGGAAPMTHLFPRPTEAKYIRVSPVTWYNRPVMRLELIGCSLLYSTRAPSWTDLCDEPMGFENGAFSEEQIEVSSTLMDQPFYGKANIRLNKRAIPGVTAGAWVAEPRPNQFIRLDFYEPSKLSGIITQGRSDGDEWVTSYTVHYSPDGINFNTIKVPSTGQDKVFPANSDRNTPVENSFDVVIETRYLEIRPVQWEGGLSMRLEVKGCFHPYTRSPLETTTTTTPFYPTVPPPPYCHACTGLPESQYVMCGPCRPGFLHNGQTCVPRALCPCYKNGVSYEVGAVYETLDCQECVCEMAGSAVCARKQCPPCEGDSDQSVLTATCNCICKPCAEGTRLCPSSNTCINETLWCDGIQNCEDDELDCPATTTPVPVVPGCPTPSCPGDWQVTIKKAGNSTRCPVYDCDPPVLTTPVNCPLPSCPPGYDIHLRALKRGLCPMYDCVLPSTTVATATCPAPACPEGYVVEAEEQQSGIDYNYYYEQQTDDTFGCPHYKCVTAEPPTAPCPIPQCPDGYEINFADTRELIKLCPQFDCLPIVTTTVCPPVRCNPGLKTLYLSTGDGECPQYTCIKVTTPVMSTATMPTVSVCPDIGLPVCGPGEELYSKNPNELCPEFGCKPIGEPVPTTGAPQVVTPECEVDGRTINTFDGTDFRLDPCNHILARDKRTDKWMVSVHRNCSEAGTCSRYLKIRQEEHQLILNPDLTIQWDATTYSVSQMQKIGAQSETFSVSRQGDSLFVQSSRNAYYVVWDVNMNINIGLEDTLLYEVDGLCGFYTGTPTDDKSKPDGSLASNTQEYGDSWALDEGEDCEPTRCSSNTTAAAFQLCNTIDSRPFTQCHDVVPPSSFLPGCVERVCSCLSEGGTEEDCKCSALTRYVTRCLEADPTAPVQDWRVTVKCYKDCPVNERYSDCHPTCEKSCDTLHSECPGAVTAAAQCSAGCFCDPGLVRKEGRCVTPDNCADCVCEGYGDPHYKSFDRHNFTFNGECSYVAARHKDRRGNHRFEVITHNKRCSRDPVTMCTDEVLLKYGEQEAKILLLPTNAILVIVEGATLSEFPYRNGWLAAERPDARHIALVVPEINLEITYSAENFGFTISVPSHLFFNETEGLCGNCNGSPDDDQMVPNGGLLENVEQFGLGWQVQDSFMGPCDIYKKEDEPCLPLPPDIDPCLKIMDPSLFGECHPLEDPVAYVSSCQLDVCLSRNPEVAACQSLSAYGQRCSQLGVCLNWRDDALCPVLCDEGLEFKVCGPGCVHTCDNYKQYEEDPEACPFSGSEGCFCPGDMVLLEGVCVNKTQCEPCDAEGHREGEVWQTDPCTSCECRGGSSQCVKKSCPQDPICDRGYNVVEIPFTSDECCGPKKKCELKPPSECPPTVRPRAPCGYGQTYQLIRSGACPDYACVCVAPQDCPPLETPNQDALKDGEEWLLNTLGCCSKWEKNCTGSCPPQECPEFYELNTSPSQDDTCCPPFQCLPPSDACIYETTAPSNPSTSPAGVKGASKGVVKGSPAKMTQASVKRRYSIGEAWSDGPCVQCECTVDADGVPYHNCVRQTCPSLNDHPDRLDYELRSINVSGECCPQISRAACIDDYEVIQVGSELPDSLNACRSVVCQINDQGRVEKVENTYTCDESCSDGWEYRPPPMYPQVCCGSCQQVACIHSGVRRQPGESWTSSDRCTKYQCAMGSDQSTLETRAVEETCQGPSEEEAELYTIEERQTPGECCPTYVRTGCLLNETTAIPVGKSLPDPKDPCITVICSDDVDGNITRREREVACTMDCPAGSVYYDPPAGSDECCGRCVPVQCVGEDALHDLGMTWTSPTDSCYDYSCVMRFDVPTIIGAKRECPFFNPECPPEEIYYDPTGCCMLCNVTMAAKRDCQAEPMDPKSTVGMFVFESNGIRCTNAQPVPLNFCEGHCDSSTTFKTPGSTPQPEAECYCCQPSEYEQIIVPLFCSNRGTYTIRRNNIKSCLCIPCGQGYAVMQDQPIADETEFYSYIKEDVTN